MKIYNVSIQRLEQIVDAYKRCSSSLPVMRTYKVSEKEVYLRIGDNSERKLQIRKEENKSRWFAIGIAAVTGLVIFGINELLKFFMQ